MCHVAATSDACGSSCSDGAFIPCARNLRAGDTRRSRQRPWSPSHTGLGKVNYFAEPLHLQMGCCAILIPTLARSIRESCDRATAARAHKYVIVHHAGHNHNHFIWFNLIFFFKKNTIGNWDIFFRFFLRGG
jgi:hypothetical protein